MISYHISIIYGVLNEVTSSRLLKAAATGKTIAGPTKWPEFALLAENVLLDQ